MDGHLVRDLKMALAGALAGAIATGMYVVCTLQWREASCCDICFTAVPSESLRRKLVFRVWL